MTAPGTDGKTPKDSLLDMLIQTAALGDWKDARKLIALGADPNGKNDQGQSARPYFQALISAAAGGKAYRQIVGYLSMYGGNLNDPDVNQNVPRMILNNNAHGHAQKQEYYLLEQCMVFKIDIDHVGANGLSTRQMLNSQYVHAIMDSAEHNYNFLRSFGCQVDGICEDGRSVKNSVYELAVKMADELNIDALFRMQERGISLTDAIPEMDISLAAYALEKVRSELNETRKYKLFNNRRTELLGMVRKLLEMQAHVV